MNYDQPLNSNQVSFYQAKLDTSNSKDDLVHTIQLNRPIFEKGMTLISVEDDISLCVFEHRSLDTASAPSITQQQNSLQLIDELP